MSQLARFKGKRKMNKRKAPVDFIIPDDDDGDVEEVFDINNYDPIEDDEPHVSNSTNFFSQECCFDTRGSLYSAIKTYHKLKKKAPMVTEIIDKAGWSLLLNIKVDPTPHPVIEALVELWWDTTHTFHFPFGEMGFTPFDWSILTGIDIGIGTKIPYDPSKYTEDYVRANIFPELVSKGWSSNSLTVAWLKNYFQDDYLDRVVNDSNLVDRVARAYFMFFLGQVLFANGKNYIHAGWLAAFENFDLVNTYDWGGTTFAYLYVSLDLASRKVQKALCGAAQILEFWFYEYLGICGPVVRPAQETEFIRPRASRWKGDKKKGTLKTVSNLLSTRTLIEGLTATSVRWHPWANANMLDSSENLKKAWEISNSRIIFLDGFDNGVWYLGDRCWRQHNSTVAIPKNPPKAMYEISSNECAQRKLRGWTMAKRYVTEVPYEMYKKYWGRVTKFNSTNVDWDVEVYDFTGDSFIQTLLAPTDHIPIPPPQQLPYGQLYRSFQETTDLVDSLRNFILSETRKRGNIIRSKDKQIEEKDAAIARLLDEKETYARQSALCIQQLNDQLSQFSQPQQLDQVHHLAGTSPKEQKYSEKQQFQQPTSHITPCQPHMPTQHFHIHSQPVKSENEIYNKEEEK